MNKKLALEIINYCKDKTYKNFTVFYRRGEVMQAVKYVFKLKSATDSEKYNADVVFWKIALRVE